MLTDNTREIISSYDAAFLLGKSYDYAGKLLKDNDVERCIKSDSKNFYYYRDSFDEVFPEHRGKIVDPVKSMEIQSKKKQSSKSNTSFNTSISSENTKMVEKIIFCVNNNKFDTIKKIIENMEKIHNLTEEIYSM